MGAIGGCLLSSFWLRYPDPTYLRMLKILLCSRTSPRGASRRAQPCGLPCWRRSGLGPAHHSACWSLVGETGSSPPPTSQASRPHCPAELECHVPGSLRQPQLWLQEAVRVRLCYGASTTRPGRVRPPGLCLLLHPTPSGLLSSAPGCAPHPRDWASGLLGTPARAAGCPCPWWLLRSTLVEVLLPSLMALSGSGLSPPATLDVSGMQENMQHSWKCHVT